MTTLFRPVLIESAEQAEALPIGTVAIRRDGDGYVWTAARRCRCQEPGCDAWFSTDWNDPHDHVNVVGASALVPIEAEEVRSEDCGGYHLLEAWTSTHPFTAYFPKENQ